MTAFKVTVRTLDQSLRYWVIARAAAAAHEHVAAAMGDVVCGITVVPA